MCHFRTQNSQFAPNQLFLIKIININFIYLLATFIVQNLKKILTANQELWIYAIFGSKMVHLLQTGLFLEKSLISSIYCPLSLWKILKQLLQPIQSYEGAPFLDPKSPICRNENSLRKSIYKPCSFHSCLSTFQKSKSDYQWNIGD